MSLLRWLCKIAKQVSYLSLEPVSKSSVPFWKRFAKLKTRMFNSVILKHYLNET